MTDIVTAAGVAGLALVAHAALAVYLYRSLSDPTAGATENAPEGRRRSDGPSRASEDERGPSQSGGPSQFTEGGPEATAPEADGTGSPSEATYCPVCGVPNDPGFRFCRRCVSELSGGGRAGGPPDHTSPG